VRSAGSQEDQSRMSGFYTRVDECNALLMEEWAGTDEGWKLVKSKRGVLVHLKHLEASPIKAGKARGLVPGSPALLLRILQSIDYYHEIDPMYAGGRVVEMIDERHEVIYAAYSTGVQLIVSPRDFIYLEGRRQMDDGTNMIACFSIERDDVPPVKGHVRGHIFESGWVISPVQPSPEDIKQAGLGKVSTNEWCEAMFLARVDVKGWIPTWLVNRLSAEMGEALHRLRKFIQEKGHTINLTHEHTDS